MHAEFSGDILKEILREIDPGLTKDELRRLIKIKLRKIGIDIPLESIKIPGKINLTGTKSKKPPIQNAESVC
ncbi:hypothetical protein LEP1GSC172_3309 [Leptospira noguchii]|uniref:Uncharacterized protein n=1 Tax=Leptospira noguchii TaxID=28182 RepID=M6VFW4_9LEPT|nr:hypothetical protein LEP1GSC172_3309 [Leptospira noguchii]